MDSPEEDGLFYCHTEVCYCWPVCAESQYRLFSKCCVIYICFCFCFNPSFSYNPREEPESVNSERKKVAV